MTEPARPDFAALFAEIQEQLACPACRGSLRLEGERLICAGCGRRYTVIDGIPVLIADASASD